MSYQDELQRLVEAKASMRQSIIDKGVDVPDDAKIEDYAGYILQIEGGGMTLDKFKESVAQGVDIESGTEVKDKYAGKDNPLIVAQKLDKSNNSSYGGAEGYILIRKYVEPIEQVFNTASNNVDYINSALQNLLNGTYMDNCSDKLKSLISDIDIPYYNGSKIVSVPSKWFAMSAYEVCNLGGNGPAGYEGIVWDYWKKQTGLASPDEMWVENSGRILYDTEGIARHAWLRSRRTNQYVCYLLPSGSVTSSIPLSVVGVLPACFVSAK